MTIAEHMAHALAQAENPHTPWELLDRDTRISARIRAVGILNALDAGSTRTAAEAGDFDADIIENPDATRQAELDDWADQWRDEKIAEELDHDEY